MDVGMYACWVVLPGDGELRDVVEQVEHQHLHGSDGVEGKPHSRSQDGEGVAERGAARELDVLDGVAWMGEGKEEEKQNEENKNNKKIWRK